MALKSIKALALASLAAGPAAAAYDCSTSKAGCTPLDDYVNAPDSTYKWEDLNITLDGPGWTAYVVNMTSHSWLTSADWDFAPRDDGARLHGRVQELDALVGAEDREEQIHQFP